VNLITFKGSIASTDQQRTLDFSAFKNLENLSISNEVQKFKFASPRKYVLLWVRDV